jgi:hypothetical protein
VLLTKTEAPRSLPRPDRPLRPRPQIADTELVYLQAEHSQIGNVLKASRAAAVDLAAPA